VGPSPGKTTVPIKGEVVWTETDTHRGEYGDREVVAMCRLRMAVILQAKEQGPQATRSKDRGPRSFPRPSEGVRPCT
jgi:hypothetical protein